MSDQDPHANCGACPEIVQLKADVGLMRQSMSTHLTAFDKHITAGDRIVESIFAKLEQISRDIGNVHGQALRDRGDFKNEMEAEIKQELRHLETQLDKFVTKGEVRLGWMVATTVIAVTLWFFSNVNTNSTITAQSVQQMQQSHQELLNAINKLAKP